MYAPLIAAQFFGLSSIWSKFDQYEVNYVKKKGARNTQPSGTADRTTSCIQFILFRFIKNSAFWLLVNFLQSNLKFIKKVF